MATVITNLLSAIPFIGADIVPLILLITLYYIYNINSINSSNKKDTSININLNNGVEKVKTEEFNKEFSGLLSLIVGFIDGDGYIRVTKKKKECKTSIKEYVYVSLVINLNKDEYNLLCEIKNILGIGIVHYVTTKKGKIARYEINKTDFTKVLIPLLEKYNIKFLTNTRQKQYLKVLYILKNKIELYKDIDNEKLLDFINENIILDNFNSLWYFNNWLVGFTMAEGSFLKKVNKDLCFKLKQKNNFILFENILVYFGTSQKLSINKGKYVEYSLSSIKDVQSIVYFFSYNNFVTKPKINNYPTVNLRGLKLITYTKWLVNIKESTRYNKIILP